MKTMFSVKAILVLAAAVLAPLVILAQTSGDQKTLTGVVSDAMCGQTHMMKDKPAAECLRYCVKQGTKYALVAGKTIYTLEGHEAELDKYAAQKVTVKGTMKGETMTVESVLPAKVTQLWNGAFVRGPAKVRSSRTNDIGAGHENGAER
jgi:hypothetical protein